MEGINILIVEDKKEDAEILESVINAQGWRAWAASNGDEAIKLCREMDFSVVLTELHMEGLNGKEITQKVLELKPNTSVVVMTVSGFLDTAIEAMELGAYGYVTKPFNAAEIRIVVRRAAERFAHFCSKDEKEELTELSIKDSLTGAYNQRFLKIYLRNEMDIIRRQQGKFSILMIDLDHFKEYNDTYGHPGGDQLLLSLSKIFHESLRQSDMVFRYGGDEFMLFLNNTDKDGAVMVAERIRNSVKIFLPATVSIGVSSFPEDGQKLEDLISTADKALYKSKQAGRNKVSLWEN